MSQLSIRENRGENWFAWHGVTKRAAGVYDGMVGGGG